MCSEMSQYMPSRAMCSETAPVPIGSAAQPGRPLTRLAKAAQRPSSGFLPLRWPEHSHSRAAVTKVAKVVAITICPTAAPPAGSLAAKSIDEVPPKDDFDQCITDPCHI